MHADMLEPKELSGSFSHASCGNLHGMHDLWRTVFSCESTAPTSALSDSTSERTTTKAQRGKLRFHFRLIRFNFSYAIDFSSLNFNQIEDSKATCKKAENKSKDFVRHYQRIHANEKVPYDFNKSEKSQSVQVRWTQISKI